MLYFDHMENMRTHRTAAALVSALILMSVALLPSGAGALEVNRRVLENGLTVLHVERTNLPVVMVTLLIRSGSVDEPAEKAGLASLTASLLTDGTKSRTSLEISEEAEFIGASLGASAGSDYSSVGLSVLRKDVDKGFELLGDVLLNPTFPKKELRRKKELTKGNLKQQEEQPGFIAGRAFDSALYGDHAYGRLVSGTAETLDLIKRKDIEGFYRTNYVPNNAILSVVGDLGEGELDGLIGKWLGGWKRGPDVTHDVPEPGRPEKKVILIDRDLKQANIMLGQRGVRRSDPDHYALTVMNYILGGGGFSSRLMDSIRDTMGLAYDVHSSFSSSMYGGSFTVSAQTKNESAKTVIDEVIRHMELMSTEPVTDQELDDAKAFLVGSFPRRIDTMNKIANFLAVVEYYGLGLDYQERYPGIINAITKEDIMDVAKRHLPTGDYVLVVVGDREATGLDDSGRGGAESGGDGGRTVSSPAPH